MKVTNQSWNKAVWTAGNNGSSRAQNTKRNPLDLNHLGSSLNRLAKTERSKQTAPAPALASRQNRVKRMYAPEQKANLQARPLMLDLVPYMSGGPGSPTGEADLIPVEKDYGKNKPYLLAAVPTSKEAGQIAEAGIANVFSEPWQLQLQDAVNRNGGLGDAENGFLAWSKIGFVRFYNDNLSPEQNRKLAAASLEMGFAVERMPSRSNESVFEKENIARWVDSFLEKYETQKAEFLQNPEKGISVKDGRKRFEVKLDKDSGQIVSYYYKKSGGFRGFVRENFKYISQITSAVSKIGAFIPGWGTVAAIAAQAVQVGANLAAQASLKGRTVLGQLISFGSNFIPGSGAMSTALRSAGVFAGQSIENGKIDKAKLKVVLKDLASAFGSSGASAPQSSLAGTNGQIPLTSGVSSSNSASLLDIGRELISSLINRI